MFPAYYIVGYGIWLTYSLGGILLCVLALVFQIPHLPRCVWLLVLVVVREFLHYLYCGHQPVGCYFY